MAKKKYRCPNCEKVNAAGSVEGFIICRRCGQKFPVTKAEGDGNDGD